MVEVNALLAPALSCSAVDSVLAVTGMTLARG